LPKVKESSFRAEVKAWVTPDGEFKKFFKGLNHSEALPDGLDYNKALNSGWLRVYKTDTEVNVTCNEFDAKEMKACLSAFKKEDGFDSLPISICCKAKVTKYKPLFKEAYKMKLQRYVSVFKEDSQSDLTDEAMPEKLRNFIINNPFPKYHEQLHSFAEGLGIEASVLEQYAYAFLTLVFAGGKSAGKEIVVDEENAKIGKQIELEHFEYPESDNPVVKKMIGLLADKVVSDHCAENDNYYIDGVPSFEDELSKEGK